MSARRSSRMLSRRQRLSQRFRRIADGYDKPASSYLVMVTIACILEWL